MRDLFGNAVTGTNPAGLAGVDAFVGGLLSYHPRAADVIAASAAAPDMPLVQIYAGMLHMLAEAPGAGEQARPFLEAADDLGGTERERGLTAALRAWIADDTAAVAAILTAVLDANPCDLGTLKLLHYHLFNRADFPAMLRAASIPIAVDPHLPYVHGMLAFAYEQLHLLDDAEAAARTALQRVPDDPWAQHALAHVMLTQGRIDEGVAFLEGAADGWRGLNSFMVTHLWWHLALFYLSQGRSADALAAYDRQVWAVAKEYSQDQIGAVSLLARLELAGLDVGARWAELGEHLAARGGDTVQPFLSVQYLYGLARAGRGEADALAAAIAARAAGGDPVWHDVAQPLARGLLAHARSDWAGAAAALTQAMPQLVLLGGSHAQRDLFDQVLLDANIRSGRLMEAQQTLELRRAHDPDGAVVNRQLAGVYAALGLPDLARRAAARVEQRLAA